jgi:Family of unknown function (DUF695)
MKNQIMLAALVFALGGCATAPTGEKHQQGNWFDVEGVTKGQVLRAKLNGDLRDKIADKNYPYQVTISQAFTPVPPDGLPSKEEQAKLDKAKEALKSLEQDKQAYLAIVITTGGMKQFIFYSSDAVRTAQGVAQIQSTSPDFEFQVSVEPDRNWSLYRALAANAK